MVDAITHIQQKARDADSVGALIGLEGAAARLYFEAWKNLIGREWKFTGRNRRPPRDPVNAMLSYGYTVLATEVLRAVSLAGLDPYCGLLHVSGRNRPSLVCDLMEEFRPLIIDTAILRLLAVDAVHPAAFRLEAAGCRMDRQVRRVLVDAIEERMLTRLTHPITRKTLTYRECIEAQAMLLARRLQDPAELYYHFPWR
jgi:CRISPR-associated protein Cas1